MNYKHYCHAAFRSIRNCFSPSLREGLGVGLLFLFSLPVVSQVVDDLPAEPHARQAAEAINQAYDYDFFFPFASEDKMHLTNAQKLDSLKVRHAAVTKMLRKLPKDVRTKYGHLNELAELNFHIRLLPRGSEERKALESRIDPNDTLGLYVYLPQCFIATQMKGNYDEAWGHDLTDYGLEYISVMKQFVTNATVKHALLEDCAQETLEYGKDYADIDRFWKSFCDYAGDDSAVIRDYQYKVEAIKRNKRGAVAPDFAFTDSLGTVHHLSDYRGKRVYIDCWATWCGPCCKEIPFLEQRVEALKGDTSLVFLSISMDSNRQAWLRKIRHDQPQWPQMIVDKPQHAALAKAYGISGIPCFIYVAADGTLIDADAFRPSDKDFMEKIACDSPSSK